MSARKACSCRDYSRSELLRTAVSEAGRGLPSIEPGMPRPAGTGLSRRSFLIRSAGMALTVYGAAALAPRSFEEGIARAMASPPTDPILVSVFLDGGADSLSVLAPVGDVRYAGLRPTLKQAPNEGTAFAEDPTLRWHPKAGPLATLHGEGKVTVFPAIGYDDANQSHFTSRHYWEVGEVNPQGRVGWLGRYLDQHGAPDNPLQGLSLGYSLFPALASGSVPVAAVASPEEYDFPAPGVWDPIEPLMHDAFGALGGLSGGDPALQGARDAAASSETLRQQMSSLGSIQEPPGYPTGDEFPKRLAAIATMLHAGLPLRCVALSGPGGYDTHEDEHATLDDNLDVLSRSLLAFQRDLEQRGLDDRVLVHVWSEFGRRPEENNGGTDHGAGGTSFLIGKRVTGTMIGEFPGLATLDATDNLRHTADFRAVYCSLLEQWLGVDPSPIIPGAAGFPRPTLVT